jgi:serine/threonine protein phosphatase PrpC
MSTQEIANCIWATINNLKGRDCETRVASGIAEIMSQAFIKKSDDNITVIFIGFKSLFLYCEDDIKS